MDVTRKMIKHLSSKALIITALENCRLMIQSIPSHKFLHDDLINVSEEKKAENTTGDSVKRFNNYIRINGVSHNKAPDTKEVKK